jgi:uncharacterized protein
VPGEIHDRLADCVGFEWDDGNSGKVRERHGVDPVECEQAFFGEGLLVHPDVRHSQNEERWFALGSTGERRPLFLVFTLRGNLIRVLQARDMNRKERRIYAESQASA